MKRETEQLHSLRQEVFRKVSEPTAILRGSEILHPAGKQLKTSRPDINHLRWLQEVPETDETYYSPPKSVLELKTPESHSQPN